MARSQVGRDGTNSLKQAALVAAAQGKKLFGLYGGKGGSFEYGVPSDTPKHPSIARGSVENPTLADAVDEAGHELTQTFNVGVALPSFTLAVLPDTQVYSEEAPAVFTAQVNWVLANAQSENIAALLHEGDVVDNGLDLTQWSNAMSSLAPLLAQSTLPYTRL